MDPTTTKTAVVPMHHPVKISSFVPASDTTTAIMTDPNNIRPNRQRMPTMSYLLCVRKYRAAVSF
jgi:hypothetical protein